jgi:hypothetical protein
LTTPSPCLEHKHVKDAARLLEYGGVHSLPVRLPPPSSRRAKRSIILASSIARHRFLLPFSVVTLDANCRRADLHAESPDYYNMASFVICGPSTILDCHSLFS